MIKTSKFGFGEKEYSNNLGFYCLEIVAKFDKKF